MNILAQILGGSLGETFSKIVGTFKASPDKVLELQKAIADNQAVINQAEEQLKAKALELEAQLNATAGENIRAEAQSGDKYTSRARPSVIYFGLLMFFWNWCLVPALAVIAGKVLPALLIPDVFVETCGAVVLGYVVMRTGQDVLNRTVGGAGGNAQGPFGMKLESKGD